jgi:RimJ/RimL family protein N-acetyltransferase
MRVLLETERLVLRRFTAADIDDLFELHNDPAVMRFLNGGKPTPRATVERETLPAFLRSYERHPGFGVWVAEEKASGAFLGWFAFGATARSRPEEAELGYRLRRAAWGRGYATEGARALIRLGFTELGVQRVVASTYQDNLASRRVMKKAGLSLVRTYRMTTAELRANDSTAHEASEPLWDGDDVEYALRKADWGLDRPSDAPAARRGVTARRRAVSPCRSHRRREGKWPRHPPALSGSPGPSSPASTGSC